MIAPLHHEHFQQVARSRDAAIEAAIVRFRDCGVEIERFSIVYVRATMETHLCVDGVPRFSVVISQPSYAANRQ